MRGILIQELESAFSKNISHLIICNSGQNFVLEVSGIPDSKYETFFTPVPFL